jgi:hypothetical protein
VQERYRKMHKKYREIRNEESRVNTERSMGDMGRPR